METVLTSPLLTSSDPPPVTCVNASNDAPVMLLCEHAGREIPAQLGCLGVASDTLRSHRGWDIGAEALARRLAEKLDAPLVIQRYSRLVIDANRPPESAAAFPEISDGVAVPGNRGLSAEARAARIDEIFKPMNRAIDAVFAAHPRKACFSVHSFTPLLGGQKRPWHAGFLSRRTPQTAQHLIASIARARPDLVLGLNEPYRIEDETDWFIPIHAETRGLPHALIEIRNDQLATAGDVAVWADLLAGAIQDLLETLP